MESVSQDSGEVKGVSAAADVVQSLAEDETIDFVTGRPVKLKGNEEVRQRIARGLYYEYRIRRRRHGTGLSYPAVRDRQRRTTKKADIAVFEPETEHTLGQPAPRRHLQASPERRAHRHKDPYLPAGAERSRGA